MTCKLTVSLVVVFFFLRASAVHAFVFDVWKSGMKENSVIETGKAKGINIVFDAGSFSLLGDKKPDKLAVKVDYTGSIKLMGYDAKLLFSFTPESRVLHSLRVSLNLPMSSDKADMEVLADSIAKQLDNKYKEHGTPSVDSFIGQIVDKVRNIGRRSWVGKGDAVTMESTWKMVGGEVVVMY
ncbi:MAG: hypothetical protein PHI31_06515, partial [Desulfuromonadaceae bacterium]|nr:hypothetical protein [Desulfuromonadaceae bacterium]